MPQIVLEHSANLECDCHIAELLLGIHKLVSEIAGVRLENCKSRRYRCDDFCVGEGLAGNAFAHLDVRFIEGRSKAVKASLGEALLTHLETAYATAIANASAPSPDHSTTQDAANSEAIQITVEVRDIRIDDYHKFPQGTLTAQ